MTELTKEEQVETLRDAPKKGRFYAWRPKTMSWTMVERCGVGDDIVVEPITGAIWKATAWVPDLPLNHILNTHILLDAIFALCSGNSPDPEDCTTIQGVAVESGYSVTPDKKQSLYSPDLHANGFEIVKKGD